MSSAAIKYKLALLKLSKNEIELKNLQNQPNSSRL